MIKSFLHSIYQASGLAAVESPWVASLLLFFALWIVFAVLTALAAPLVRGIRSPSATLRAIVGTTVMALASLALVNVVGIP